MGLYICGDLIHKQAVHCHRVLRLALQLATSGDLGASEWRSLLLLLLSAAAALLSPPAPHHSDANQLLERVLCVLFEVWILACHRCFPSPPLWRTLQGACLRWRHRPALVAQWTRASLCLTARLTHHMFGPLFPRVPVAEEDANLVPADMSADAVLQAWYRILHTIGNPVDLCRPHVISQTPDFLQYSITQEANGADPSQYPCLQALPDIFHKAMQGIAAHVDAFLGTPRPSLMGLSSRPVSVAATTPPNSINSQVLETERPPLTPLRPKVNSIFHLFGEWLFEAAMIGTTPTYSNNQQRSDFTPPPPSSLTDANELNTMSYQAGRASALGTVCRVLCSAWSREAVLAPYLARSYAALHRGLRDPATAPAVLLHAKDIFRLDLDGVLVLVMDFISALERILPEPEPKLEYAGIDKAELRKAAISLLLSMQAFPHHYRGLPVPEFPGCNEYAGVTLGEATRGRLSLLCIAAVQVETSAALAVPLLGALYQCVRHNAHAQARGVPAPGSTLSHHTDFRARSESGSAAGSDAPSVEFADARDPDPASPMFGAALVVRATSLVCDALKKWNVDLQVSLAALELLSGLAKLHSDKPEAVERKRAVRDICDYITQQCSRPPPAHSRDLHSCVVAAYSCLASWLCPALLADSECLATLMEVVELGISGSKSQGNSGEPPKMKDEKELKPVSMRVRDAAESLLMLILEQVGSNAPDGAWCRLDERWLRRLGHGKLRHYVVDGSLLLTLLEEPLANSQQPQPTLIVLARTGRGRRAWQLMSRGAPRSALRSAPGCARPVDMRAERRAPPRRRTEPLPSQQDHQAPTDAAFPSLESVLRQLNDPEAPTLFKLLEQQAAFEKRVRETEDNNITPEEYVPPEPVTEFQTARLFLSNFGYLNISADKKSGPPRLVALDSAAPGFAAALRRLDCRAARAATTVHVFCARAGQLHAADIVANAREPATLPPEFKRLLKNLGTPVKVAGHPGWTGHVATSYDAAPEDVKGRQDQVIYWSDATNEIAFVVPSAPLPEPVEEESEDSNTDGCCMSTRSAEREGGSCWEAPLVYSRSSSETERERRGTGLGGGRAMSLDLDKQPGITGSGRRNQEYTTKILLIWLEDFEDHLNMPIDALLEYCDCGLPWRRHEVSVVYLCALRSGLVRVRAAGGGGAGGALPDGALLSAELLPACLLRAAADREQRATQHSQDVYQPPHVRRRHIIQDIAQQYKLRLSEPELLETLFRTPQE